jgi:endonuclease/exonuclease/phosphatase family metal-dependent hydrolase
MHNTEVLQPITSTQHSTSSPLTETNSNPSTSLKIISWNIYMLPRHTLKTGQLERAHEIVDVLKEQDADIIVLEEAFDGKAREIIRDGLKFYFPYESGDPPKNTWWRTNSGIWIISKIPFTIVKNIYFKRGKGPDWFACKGAMLIEAKKNNFSFHVIGTHLQSDFGGKKSQEIRRAQYEQIRKELLEPYNKKTTPQFLVGDFNTIHHESLHYEQMLSMLEVKSCSLEGDCRYSYDYSTNDFITGINNQPQLIDYILYSDSEHHKIEGKMFINMFRKQWHSNHFDLSDHFAVTGIFHLFDRNSDRNLSPI